MIIYLCTIKSPYQYSYQHYFYNSDDKRYINARAFELKLDNTLCLCDYIDDDDGDTFTQSFSNINEKIIIFTEDNIDISFLENILLDKIISTI